jgi:hypothetical protein
VGIVNSNELRAAAALTPLAVRTGLVWCPPPEAVARKIADPAEAIRSAVADALRDHRAAAVLFAPTGSGVALLGLAAADCRAAGRNLTVVVPEAVRADGTSAAVAATPVLAALAPGATIRTVEEADRDAWAGEIWCPAGPSPAPEHAALPAALALAGEDDATVLLVPAADTVLDGPTPGLLAALPSRAAAGYLRAVRASYGWPGVWAELAGHDRGRLRRAVAAVRTYPDADEQPQSVALHGFPLPGFLSAAVLESAWQRRSGDALPQVQAPLLAPTALAALARTALGSLVSEVPDVSGQSRPVPAPRASDVPLAIEADIVDPAGLPRATGRLGYAVRSVERWLTLQQTAG